MKALMTPSMPYFRAFWNPAAESQEETFPESSFRFLVYYPHIAGVCETEVQ